MTCDRLLLIAVVVGFEFDETNDDDDKVEKRVPTGSGLQSDCV